MFFVGHTFMGGNHSVDASPSYISAIKKITLTNGIFNDLYITKKSDYVFTSNLQWDFDTILHATYDGHINAGNITLSVNQISSFKIKRRKSKDYNWEFLFEIPVSSVENFSFERFDKYIASHVPYEYTIIPVNNNIEGEYNINSITPEFDGMFIVDKDNTFSTFLNTKVTVQRNQTSTTVNTLDSEYPFVFKNSKNNYDSGSASGVFIDYDYVTNEYKVKEGYELRVKLNDWMLNGNPKILKMDDGRTWLINVVDNISEEQDGWTDKVTTNFSWVATGNANSALDLYTNGLIDAIELVVR